MKKLIMSLTLSIGFLLTLSPAIASAAEQLTSPVPSSDTGKADVAGANSKSGEAFLIINKILIPASSSNKFRLLIDSNVAGGTTNGVGNGGTTGLISVSPGNHIISESSANTATHLSDYTSIISGDCDAAGHVTLIAGEHKACTITNTLKGNPIFTIHKIVVPSTDPGKFVFGVTDSIPYFGSLGVVGVPGGELGNGGNTIPMSLISTGSHLVSESAGTNTDMSNYTAAFSGDCDATGHITLALGDNKTCIITNTKIHRIVAPHGWSTMTSMPTKRYDLGVAVVGNILYAMGGSPSLTGCNSTSVDTVEAYDSTTDTWTPKAHMLTPRTNFSVGVVNGIIYAIGGHKCTGGVYTVNTMEAYDPATDTWIAKASLPVRLAQMSAGVINGHIYVVGGLGASGTGGVGSSFIHADTLLDYNPACDVTGSTCPAWTTKHHLPTALRQQGVRSVNGILYVVGGIKGTGVGMTNQVLSYNPTTDAWTTVAPMQTKRINPGVEVINNILYVLGGRTAWGSGHTTATMETYQNSAWSASVPMSIARSGLGAGVINGTLYAVGGTNNSSTIYNTLEAYRP